MRNKRLTVVVVMGRDDENGNVDIVVIGAGRTSRRRLRVRAKFLARQIGVCHPVCRARHTKETVEVLADMHVEIMP